MIRTAGVVVLVAMAAACDQESASDRSIREASETLAVMQAIAAENRILEVRRDELLGVNSDVDPAKLTARFCLRVAATIDAGATVDSCKRAGWWATVSAIDSPISDGCLMDRLILSAMGGGMDSGLVSKDDWFLPASVLRFDTCIKESQFARIEPHGANVRSLLFFAIAAASDDMKKGPGTRLESTDLFIMCNGLMASPDAELREAAATHLQCRS